jgi:hypothetical protein
VGDLDGFDEDPGDNRESPYELALLVLSWLLV